MAEKYWCPYCGEPQREDNIVKSWRFHSRRGGSYFIARILKCHKCGRKVRVTEKEPGVPYGES